MLKFLRTKSIKMNFIYKRAKSGKIQIWDCVVAGNELRTIEGLLGGALTTSEPTICKPKNIGKKNETSAEQQATIEATARREKKLKSGGYHESIDEVDNHKYFEPMLAKKLNDEKHKLAFPCWVSIKLNGNRCVLKKDGAFTRKGERYMTIPHIEESFKEFFNIFPDAVLDGELFNEDLKERLNNLNSIIRRTTNITPEHLKKSEEMVKFYIYDGLGFGADLFHYGAKLDQIRNLAGENPYFREVETYRVSDLDHIYHYYNKFIERNHEGAIVRSYHCPYKHGRSSDLLKVKPENSSEGRITAIYEGKGNWAGVAKTATLEWIDAEEVTRVFDATFKGSLAECKEILENPTKWLDKEVTFLYNSLTGLGVPNFARIDVNNCFKS